MGHQENSLRHLGMIATSHSWRRHFFLQNENTLTKTSGFQDDFASVFVENFRLLNWHQSLADWMFWLKFPV